MTKKFESELSQRESRSARPKDDAGDSLFQVSEIDADTNAGAEKTEPPETRRLRQARLRKPSAQPQSPEKLAVPPEKDLIMRQLKAEADTMREQVHAWLMDKLEEDSRLDHMRGALRGSMDASVDNEALVEKKRNRFRRVCHRVEQFCAEVFRKVDVLCEVDPDYEYPTRTVQEPLDEGLREQKVRLFQKNAQLIKALAERLEEGKRQHAAHLEKALDHKLLRPDSGAEDAEALTVSFKGKTLSYNEFLASFVERERKLLRYMESALEDFFESIEQRKAALFEDILFEFNRALELEQAIDYLTNGFALSRVQQILDEPDSDTSDEDDWAEYALWLQNQREQKREQPNDQQREQISGQAHQPQEPPPDATPGLARETPAES